MASLETTVNLTAEELGAWRGLLRVHTALVKALDAELTAEHDLPLSSYEVLITLESAPGHKRRMAELADSVLLSRSGMTRLVDRLERDGLLVRDTCTDDGRGCFAVLTESGQELIKRARPTHLDGVRERFLAHFSPDELRVLAHAWDRILPGGSGDRLMADGRERILETAYELFSRHGTRAVGVDRIVAEAGAAKMTLYRNFASKDELIVAFLDAREQRWLRDWLIAEVEARATAPDERLLTIFDVFGEWFALPDFEGCSFINVMLEIDDREDVSRAASVRYLSVIREFLAGLAAEVGIADPDAFARQWHILMKGSIVAAAEGDAQAAARAREMGELLLAARR